MKSKAPFEALELETALRVTEADLIFLRRAPPHLEGDTFFVALAALPEPSFDELRCRGGPAEGAPFRLE